ncbi:MAG TPA: hypothetical protein VFZ85_07600 [Jiangellaceae bacterium]
MMERVLETYHFGRHKVDVLEHAGDDGTTYSILVDNLVVTESPLAVPPRFEDVVRIYDRVRERTTVAPADR